MLTEISSTSPAAILIYRTTAVTVAERWVSAWGGRKIQPADDEAMKEWKIFRRGGEDFFLYGTLFFWCCEKCENKKGEKENGNFLCGKRERMSMRWGKTFGNVNFFFLLLLLTVIRFVSSLTRSYLDSMSKMCIYSSIPGILQTFLPRMCSVGTATAHRTIIRAESQIRRKRESAMNLECEWRHKSRGRRAGKSRKC